MNVEEFSDGYKEFLSTVEQFELDLNDPTVAYQIGDKVLDIMCGEIIAAIKNASKFIRYIVLERLNTTVEEKDNADMGENPAS